MKPGISRKTLNEGSGFLAVLITCTLVSIGMAAYLSTIRQQTMLSARSQTWNVAMAIVEAGIEEGLEHLNNNYTNLASQGWTASGTSYSRGQTLADGNSYVVTIDNSDAFTPSITAKAFVNSSVIARNRLECGFFAAGNLTLGNETVARAVRVKCSKGRGFTAAAVCKHNIDLNGNGVLSDSYDSGDPNKSTNGRYDAAKYTGDFGDIATNGGIQDSVGVQNANIYGKLSTGPGCPVSIGPNGGVGTHAWQATHSGIQPTYLSQDANFTFPDTTMPSVSGLFAPPSGDVLVAKYTFSTNAVTTASFPNPQPTGGVATNSTYVSVNTCPSPAPAGLTVSTVTVLTNTLPTPLPADLITNYSTSVVKSSVYPTQGSYIGGVTTNSGTKKYTYNHIDSQSYSYTLKSYTYPSYTYTYSATGTNVSYTTNHFDHILAANGTNYAMSLSGKTYVAGPNACLILPNGLSGAEDVTIAQGASVLIYAGGTSITVSGNQVLNPNGFAGSFIVYAAPSVTSFTLNGNGECTGVVVAPNADLKLNGGGNSDQDFCGSMMVNSIRLNGHFKFHYDEALKRTPGNGRFLIASWDEINPY